ncbi:MAG: hypothetical protein Q8R60_08555 [Mycobacteriales bacterium]|nr:hypothetical protein [Mycobacteriales bacterium]
MAWADSASSSATSSTTVASSKSISSSYSVGDIVGYRVPEGTFGAGNVVIHRLMGGDGRAGWRTQGDNRTSPDPWRPTDDDIAGRLVWSTPGGGSVLSRAAEPVPLGLLCGGLTALVLAWPDRKRKATAPAAEVLPRGPGPQVVVVRRTARGSWQPTDLPSHAELVGGAHVRATPAPTGCRPALSAHRVQMRPTLRRAWACTDLPGAEDRRVPAAAVHC